ncbi:unnamed protein product, partial [Laminaria digitata]
ATGTAAAAAVPPTEGIPTAAAASLAAVEEPGVAAIAPTPDAPSTVWVAAAAAAAAAATAALAKARETEILTSTEVEVVPADSRWGEQFTMAVHKESSVGEIRVAVWEEMRSRGLISISASPPAPTAAASGEAAAQAAAVAAAEAALATASAAVAAMGMIPSHQEEEGGGSPFSPERSLPWGRTPAALRLRERQARLPAAIVRDVEGKVARLRHRPYGAAWVLVAQALPDDEDLGRPLVPVSDHPDGEDGAAAAGAFVA